ncbi:hypothetical protein ACQP2E_28005 [Actinoplanes sp. CA-015351]|uniref:hypothetical protein n=1 Tax=Actinoplanes sp. CA-015351 TaxID=3239897 RepID=UPI003D96DF12
MTDPYALPEHRDDVPAAPGRPPRAAPAGRPALLWSALVMALVLNALSSVAGWPLPVQLATGVITLCCAALLIARRVRRR